jgi:apolipoprotein N-acyltransferase
LSWKIDTDPKSAGNIILSAGLFSLSFAPTPFGFLIYFAFIPQFDLFSKTGVKKGFLIGYLLGLFINIAALYWVIPYSPNKYLWLVLANAFPFALFGLIFSFLFRISNTLALVSFPFLWTFLEYIRQLGDLAFNWLGIAYTQTYFLAFIQYAEITGHLGVVFWICLVNTLFYLLWKYKSDLRKKWYVVFTIMVVFIVPLIYGQLKLGKKEKTHGISIGYIQPNIDPWEKWQNSFRDENLRVLINMTDSLLAVTAKDHEPQIIVWPETALPFTLINHKKDLALIKDYVAKNKIHLVTGTLDASMIDNRIRRYNAALFLSPLGSGHEIYRKLSLVPFEEKLPFQDFFSSLLNLDINDQYLSSGDSAVVFTMSMNPYDIQFDGGEWSVLKKASDKETIAFSCLICFESMFSNLVGEFFQNGAQIMFIITNDGWFGYSSQPYQHAQLAIFRAIEHRTSVIQCANNGISTFIDPYGRMYNSSQLFRASFAQMTIPIKLEDTVYDQYGDILGIICGIICLSLVLYYLYYFRKKTRIDNEL